ncbi:peptidoglycan DD-metalloendopeptidase family protein [Pusillimonas sp. TS35]|nr:peptidoglycan DD-metalloendopeptidase family protein [Pusillimonas sp. TS35]
MPGRNPEPLTSHTRFPTLSISTSAARRLVAGCLLSLLVACGTAPPAPSGHYRVKAGDTLYRIARNHGQTVSSLMRMNGLHDPSKLEVGQLLRVGGDAGSTASTAAPAQSGSAPSASTASRPAAERIQPAQSAGTLKLIWPAAGKVATDIKGPSTYGLHIVNKPGTPVVAVADGKVVYAGNKLRGYGNLVIIDHRNGYLSVYAHNRTLHVRENQQVRKGQKIADMGSTESRHTNLYFELRHNGKPVSARRYLPGA